jgi:hypothetical protein
MYKGENYGLKQSKKPLLWGHSLSPLLGWYTRRA